MRQLYALHAQKIGQTASGLFETQIQRPIGQTVSDQLASTEKRPFSLSWSHHVFLLGIKKPDERSFYEIEATQQNWTLRELRRQFQSGLYEHHLNCYVKTDAEAASIGIVLCKKKHEALVEITLPKDANIHAREYQLYLPSKEELQQKLVEWVGDDV